MIGKRLQPALYPFLIVLVGVLIYANSFQAPFHFDDLSSIAEKQILRDWTQWQALWRSEPSRFILNFSLALNYRLGGLEVFGYHLVNLLIHLGAALFSFWLVRLLLHSPRLARSDAARHSSEIALFSALLFVAHPIQTQAVTYIIQRAESLAALFYLLALALYLKARQGALGTSAVAWYLGSWLVVLLGMLTKQTTASLPLALLLCEWLFLEGRWGGRRGRFCLLVPFCLVVALPLSFSPPQQTALTASSELLSPGTYLLTQSRVLITYLRLLFLPINQNLDYDYPVSRSLGEPTTAAPFLLLLGIAGLGFLFCRRRPLLSFCILWFFVTLSVTSSVIPIADVIFEHRLYLATLGYGLFLSQAAAFLGGRLKGKGNGGRWAWALFSLIVMVYAAGAYQRNQIWKDELTLWRDNVGKSPRKFRPYLNLGVALIEAGKFHEAVPILQTAISLHPTHERSHYNLALAYQNLGLLDMAAASYRKAISLKPGYSFAHNNLGKIYALQGRDEAAVAEFEAALRADSNNDQARENHRKALGWLIEEYRQRLSREPTHLELRHRLAALHLKRGDYPQAIEEYREILRIAPHHLPARNNLGFAYSDLGRWDEAIREQRRVLKQDPSFANAYYGLALAYEGKGEGREAAAAWVEYLRRVPPGSFFARRARERLRKLLPHGR